MSDFFILLLLQTLGVLNFMIVELDKEDEIYEEVEVVVVLEAARSLGEQVLVELYLVGVLSLL